MYEKYLSKILKILKICFYTFYSDEYGIFDNILNLNVCVFINLKYFQNYNHQCISIENSMLCVDDIKYLCTLRIKFLVLFDTENTFLEIYNNLSNEVLKETSIFLKVKFWQITENFEEQFLTILPNFSVFFSFFKCKYFNNLLTEDLTLRPINSFCILVLRVEGPIHSNEIQNAFTTLGINMNAQFNEEQPIIENVLINQNEFGEIFAFSRDKTTFQNSLGDPDDPRVSIETLCRKSDVNNCNTLYEFLKEKTKEEYHKYIYIIISLKILSHEEATLNGCNISKIIIEFCFLQMLQEKNLERTKIQKSQKKYRKDCINIYNQILDQKRILYIEKKTGNIYIIINYLNLNFTRNVLFCCIAY
ncbi:hypothetical protein CWI36_0153p0020 [Hamiltosporidium magnivora]|uniref:Uncharacterized protein n=1 Tax=Hamiltosporidium magnivora TaxID=148818 RepID=A0A4Q9LJJ3_9MICR|nr:hypothetical protein CWI36_0153p0020 [Hamiltosporidium magnivora]